MKKKELQEITENQKTQIFELFYENRKLQQQVADANVWINILGEQLAEREAQIIVIKQALGSDAVPKYSDTHETGWKRAVSAALNNVDEGGVSND